MKNGNIVKLWAGAVLACAASGAMADWTFTSSNVSTDQGVTATAGAYSILNQTSAPYAFSSTATFSSATLNVYSGGLGVSSGSDGGEPTHAMDNNERTDLVMFTFKDASNAAKAVHLSSLSFGYAPGDADFSVLYFSKTTTPVSITGKTWTQLYDDGWRLLSNNDANGTGTKTIAGDASVYSSWWIVSAFNTGFGSSANGDGNDDYFKLATLAGSVQTTTPPNRTPEPASLALMGLALAGSLAARRRSSARRQG